MLDNSTENVTSVPEEIWKDVKNYEGRYQISDKGRLKRPAHIIIRKDGKPYPYEEKDFPD